MLRNKIPYDPVAMHLNTVFLTVISFLFFSVSNLTLFPLMYGNISIHHSNATCFICLCLTDSLLYEPSRNLDKSLLYLSAQHLRSGLD